MSDVHTHGSDTANGSPPPSPSRRRLAPGGLEDDGSIGCADASTPRGIRDTSLLPVPRPRSPSNRHPARPQQSARPAQEPNPCSFACSRLFARRPIKPNSTESEADPEKVRFARSRCAEWFVSEFIYAVGRCRLPEHAEDDYFAIEMAAFEEFVHVEHPSALSFEQSAGTLCCVNAVRTRAQRETPGRQQQPAKAEGPPRRDRRCGRPARARRARPAARRGSAVGPSSWGSPSA